MEAQAKASTCSMVSQPTVNMDRPVTDSHNTDSHISSHLHLACKLTVSQEAMDSNHNTALLPQVFPIHPASPTAGPLSGTPKSNAGGISSRQAAERS